MRRRSRNGAVGLCATLVMLLLLPGAAAGAPPRVPQSEAEWASMSAAEKTATMAYLESRLQTRLADGTAQVRQVSKSVTVTTPASESSAGRSVASAAAVSVTYNCMVQWVTFPGEGDWVRGGGWTDASDYIDRIYASNLSQQGQFLRDGQLKANWYQDLYGAAHAESWTGYQWAFFWEYVHWTTKGWHGAYDNGSWLLGPNTPCTVDVWL